jgi:spermidine synthase
MVAYSGNELSAGVMLAAWLTWTAVGSILLGLYADRVRTVRGFFSCILMSLAVMLPLSLLGVRSVRPILAIPAGEIASLPQMVVGIFVLLGPLCVLSGSLFSLGCSLLSRMYGRAARAVALVYACEAVGAGVGGLVFSYALIHLLNSWQIAVVTSAILCVGAAAVVRKAWVGVLGGIILVALSLSSLGARVDLATRGWAWGGYETKATSDSIYGNITVVGNDAQISLFENGLWNFTHPDPLTAENAVHFAMLEHSGPREVVLIGGGVGGLVGELVKYSSVAHIDYVELDPELVRLSTQHLPSAATTPLNDPRVRTMHTDGRRFIRETRRHYDVVIVHLPDPVTAQINRFYTQEFFEEVKNALRPGGLVQFSVGSSENVIGATLARFLGSMFETMSTVFADVKVLPGETATFLGSSARDVLAADPERLVDRIRERGIQLTYVREYYLLDNLAEERIAYLHSLISQGESRINRDFRPICYFYNIVLWGAQSAPWIKDWFAALLPLRIEWVLVVIGVLTLIGMPAAMRPGSSIPLLGAVSVIGFSEIGLEIILILAFQIMYGYLYYKIGMIVTAYMVGLAAGGATVIGLRLQERRPGRLFVAIHVMMALYAVGCLGCIETMHGATTARAWVGVAERGFPVLTFIAGVLGGLHFPLAGAIYLAERTGVGRAGGILNGVDLLGSAAGALIISIVLVPLLGIANGILVIVAVNIGALALLLPWMQRRGGVRP